MRLTDSSGAVIAGATKTDELLQSDFLISINNVTYHIRAPPLAKGGKLRVTQAHPKFQVIADYLLKKSETTDTLPLADYLSHLEAIGIAPDTGIEMLGVANNLGYVIHFNGHVELGDVIFLKPEKVSASLDSMLDLPSVSRTTDEKLAVLQKLREEIEPMDDLSALCLANADKISHRIATAGFLALAGQFMLYARLTWWESDWDVMEPITYFTTVMETVILGMFWFLWQGSEYAHMDLRTALMRWQLKSQHKKRGYDPVKHKALKAKIADLETELEFENPSDDH